jgi:hypothetical protein
MKELLLVLGILTVFTFEVYYWNAKGYHEGMQEGTARATEVSLKQFQAECNESFDQLQTYGILADDKESTRKRNWDYIQVLLCNGKHAGETP